MQNSAILKETRNVLEGKWTLAVITYFVYSVILGGVSGWPGLNWLNLLIGGPLAYGAALFALNMVRGKEAMVEQLFTGFNQFGRTLIAYLLVVVFVFLWSLLLIIPGIIKAMAYSQTFFIMNDDDAISGEEAINKSMRMMDGYKMQYFLLNLRFFLLAVLCIFTLGIGFLFLFPYVFIAYAHFYEMVKENYQEAPASSTAE